MESIIKKLKDINDYWELGLEISLPGTDLFLLIKKLSVTTKKKVVVLIDEYDAPVSDNIGNIELAKKNRDILKSFYSGFKDTDKYLRFVFVTGVTRYAFMGLSAGLNQLKDLTLNKKYSAICGFTHAELKSCFQEHLPITLEELKDSGDLSINANIDDLLYKILEWYDGYSWDGQTKVLNPWSILNFFDEAQFSDFWVQTNPSVAFLTKLIKDNPFNLLKNNFDNFSQNELGLAEVGGLLPIPGLFQTGYLTIDKITAEQSNKRIFSLKTPNFEIKDNKFAFFSTVLFQLLGRDPAIEKDKFETAIKERDGQKLTDIFHYVYGDLPAEHHQDSESFYHSVLYGYCKKFGRLVLAEHKESIGNPDLILIFPDDLFAVIELKFEASKKGQDILDDNKKAKTKVIDKGSDTEKLLTKLAQEALDTIYTKKYWLPYVAPAKDLVKIGLGVTSRGQCRVLIGD